MGRLGEVAVPRVSDPRVAEGHRDVVPPHSACVRVEEVQRVDRGGARDEGDLLGDHRTVEPQASRPHLARVRVGVKV